MRRSAERAHCVVVSVDTNVVENATLALEFALEEHPSRFLPLGGKLALDAAYNALPVRSLVGRPEFLHNNAARYCEHQESDAHEVSGCLDSPPYVINVKVVDGKKKDEGDLLLITWIVVLAGASFALIVGKVVESRLKTD